MAGKKTCNHSLQKKPYMVIYKWSTVGLGCRTAKDVAKFHVLFIACLLLLLLKMSNKVFFQNDFECISLNDYGKKFERGIYCPVSWNVLISTIS